MSTSRYVSAQTNQQVLTCAINTGRLDHVHTIISSLNQGVLILTELLHFLNKLWVFHELPCLLMFAQEFHHFSGFKWME